MSKNSGGHGAITVVLNIGLSSSTSIITTVSVETAAMLYQGLKDQGLLVRYWGSRPDLNDKLRVTIGTRESNQRFVSLVTELLAGGNGGKGGAKKQKKK